MGGEVLMDGDLELAVDQRSQRPMKESGLGFTENMASAYQYRKRIEDILEEKRLENLISDEAYYDD